MQHQTEQELDPNGNPKINLDDLTVWDQCLKDFKPPKKAGRPIPYVLFGKVNFDRSKEKGGIYPYPSTHCLRVNNGHAQPAKLEHYYKKGMKILDYWLPTKADLPKRRDDTEHGWVLKVRGEDDPYEELREAIEYLKSDGEMRCKLTTENKALADENVDLQQKIAELQSKLAKAEKKSRKDLEA